MSDAPGFFMDWDGNIRSTGDPGGGYSCEVDRPARYVGVRAKNGALMHEATFYKDLAAIEKAGLLAGFATRCVRRGQLISSPGQADNLVFIVRSGRLRVCLASQERELTLAFLARGDVFSTHTPAWITATEPGEVLVMGATRQTISTAPSQLQKQDIVSRQGRKQLLINDMARLQAWCAAD